jgi:hypothetical protein
VPKIAEFYGIAIYMYFRDHGAPHFHAIYGDHEAVFAIQGLRLLEGQLPRRALALVRAWAKLHGDELQRNWELARANRSLRQIAPLE